MTSISTVSAAPAAVSTATLASRATAGTAIANASTQETAKQKGSKEIIAQYEKFTDIATDDTGKYTLDERLKAWNAANFLFWSRENYLSKADELDKPVPKKVSAISARLHASSIGERIVELDNSRNARFHASSDRDENYATITREWFRSLSDDDKKIYTASNLNGIVSSDSTSIFDADGTISSEKIATHFQYQSVAQFEQMLDRNVEGQERAKALHRAEVSHHVPDSASEAENPSAAAASNAAPAVVADDQGAGVAQLARSASAATQSLTASLLPLFTTYDASGASAPHYASAESGGYVAHRGGRLFGASPRVTAGGYARRDTIA